MAESAPDLTARCQPLDFDGRTAIRTGKCLVHAHSLEPPPERDLVSYAR